MNADLQFDPVCHTYTLNGRVLPSVTRILDSVMREYADIPPDVLRAAQERGTAVHRACELHDLNDLDYVSLDSAIYPYLEAYMQFLADTGFKPEVIEGRVVSNRYGYAGTLDRIGTARHKKHRWLVDLKTSTVLSRAVGPQLAAYDNGAREYALLDQKEKIDRYALQLGANGKYKLLLYKSAADMNAFLSALVIHNFINGAKP